MGFHAVAMEQLATSRGGDLIRPIYEYEHWFGLKNFTLNSSDYGNCIPTRLTKLSCLASSMGDYKFEKAWLPGVATQPGVCR